jgi:septum formation inhibitor-activating ATPase MinD
LVTENHQKIHNRATHLNKSLIRNKNKNGTLLVNVSNSTVKNIFENGMIPKLIKKTAHHSVEYILWAN